MKGKYGYARFFCFIGRKEAMDKVMLMDALCCSMDEYPPTILIFIFTDIDFSTAIHKLS